MQRKSRWALRAGVVVRCPHNPHSSALVLWTGIGTAYVALVAVQTSHDVCIDVDADTANTVMHQAM